MANVTLPFNFKFRPYQVNPWMYLQNGGKRAALVYHRRAGKDLLALHYTATAAHQRIGNYWHMLPTAKQARKVVWDAIDPNAINPRTGRKGAPLLDTIYPSELVAKKNETEMKLTMHCGSTLQLVGSDNYNSLVGSPPVGIVFSEWALADPQAWTFLAPILLENDGFAIFAYTPRGRNHGYKTYQYAVQADNWFGEKLTILDTVRRNGEPVITEEGVQDLLDQGLIDEDDINQEFYCSFEGGLKGAYYAKLIAKARAEGRITKVPYDPSLPVETWWDLGVNDETVIWFIQRVFREIHVIDFYKNSGEGIPHYVKELQKKPYVYGTHRAPHDIEVRELGTGVSRKETAQKLGLRFTTSPKLDRNDGISAVRTILPRCWFDAEKCEVGIDGLSMYRKEWDSQRRVFLNEPEHDWASHVADAFRTGATGRPRRDDYNQFSFGVEAPSVHQAVTEFEVM